jgi:PhnB protein
MASRLTPYLSFDGTARAALEYYQEVFGGTLTVNTFGEFGAATGPEADNIMHGRLETASGYTIMGADTPPGAKVTPGSSITMSLSGDDSDALSGYWAKLSDSGTVSVPFEKQMWGDVFGMCTDKFGIGWMVNVSAQE